MLPWQPTKRTNPNITMSSSKDHTHTQTFMYNYNSTTPVHKNNCKQIMLTHYLPTLSTATATGTQQSTTYKTLPMATKIT